MHPFKDAAGREWQIRMSIGQARKLKDDIGIDVLDGGDSLSKLATDPYTTANCLYILCESQANESGVSDEQFGESLAGDVIDSATEALLAELVDFFPKRQREALRTMLAKLNGMQEAAAKMGTEKLNSKAMDELIEKELAKASQEIDAMMAGGSSGNVPVRLATTGAA